MATRNIAYDDSTGFNFARPVQDGKTVVTFPFLMNGDTAARIYSRSLVQTEASYVPIVPGKERDSFWPGGDNEAWNLPDTPLTPTGIGDLVTFTRGYARIPKDQITYPPRTYIAKPDYTPTSAENPFTVGATSYGAATRWSDWASLGTASYAPSTGLFTSGDSKVYSPIMTATARTPGYATAGTFTITYGANTTGALNYNDSDATITAAVNALASVVSGGLVVSVYTYLQNSATGGALTISITTGSTSTAFTMNTGSLTVNTFAAAITSVISTTTQQIRLPTSTTVTAHGLSASLALVAVYPSVPAVFVIASGSWGVIDANTLWMPYWGNNNYLAQLVGTYSSTYTGPASTSYVGGIRFPRVRLTEKFYLPGVSAGITSPTDIPVPSDLQNPDDFLDMLLTDPSGYETYRVEGPSLWIGGPIYRVAIEELYFPDLV